MTKTTQQTLSIGSMFATLILASACSDEPRQPISQVPVTSVNEPQPAAIQESVPTPSSSVTATQETVEVQAEPKSLDEWVKQAREQMDQLDYSAALESSHQALMLDADSAKALHVHGRALLALNRAGEALETLSAAHEAAPENGYIANTLGYALIQSGRFDEAIIYLEAARERIGQVAYVRNNLGVAYERVGRTAEAIAEYQAAAAAGDSQGKAAMSLARLGVPVADAEALVTVARDSESNSSQN
jgi:tetratricopeptide (TPR) repeat protein